MRFNANMPDFTRPAVSSAQRLMVDDEAAADANLPGAVDERCGSLGNAWAGMGDRKGCQVGLVRNEGDVEVVEGVGEFVEGNVLPAEVWSGDEGVARDEAGEGKCAAEENRAFFASCV